MSSDQPRQTRQPFTQRQSLVQSNNKIQSHNQINNQRYHPNPLQNQILLQYCLQQDEIKKKPTYKFYSNTTHSRIASIDNESITYGWIINYI